MKMINSDFLRLAEDKGYLEFTPLQQEVFSSQNLDAISSLTQNLLVIGATSSGKTLIPELLFLRDVRNSPHCPPRMLFIVPYRALAAQKWREFRTFFEEEKLCIEQSTGEFRKHDVDIIEGRVDIGIIIEEKAFIFSANNPQFLMKYQYIIFDEFAITESRNRGSRVDMLLSMIVNMQKNRLSHQKVIALGTPFFDWSAYAKAYDFYTIIEKERPIQLMEIPTLCKKMESSFSADIFQSYLPENYLLQWPYKIFRQKVSANNADGYSFAASGEFVPSDNPLSRQADFLDADIPFDIGLIARLCRYHLLRNHQILVFRNDRGWVRQASVYLHRLLMDLEGNLLNKPPTEFDCCKRNVLKDCNLFEEELYGILQDDHYRAFQAGIAFHSSALPNQLRTYVEMNFLDKKNLKVVLATETLGFGINSAVETVIISDMTKATNGVQRFLTLNEYCNYKGRAGRGLNQETVGYVYPMLRISGKASNKQIQDWNALKEQEKNPPKRFSRLLNENGSQLPFFLLALIPPVDEDGVSKEELSKFISSLPRNQSSKVVPLERMLDDSLAYLVKNGLVERKLEPLDEDEEYMRTKRRSAEHFVYRLKTLGCSMRGYILSKDDYERIVRSLQQNYIGDSLQEEPFLRDLIFSEVAQDALKNIFSESRGLDEYAFLEALRMWREMESQRRLYEAFSVTYPMIDKLIRAMNYLVEIAQRITYVVRLSGTLSQKEETREKLRRQLQHLHFSIQYGIDSNIYDGFYQYLHSLELSEETETKEIAWQMSQRYSIDFMEPIAATFLRRYFLWLNAYVKETLKEEQKFTFPEEERQVLQQYAEMRLSELRLIGTNKP